MSGLLVLVMACCRCSSQATVGCPRWHERSDSFDRCDTTCYPGVHQVTVLSRVCCLMVNLVICLAQVVTVPLCLVGWCWSVGWGVSIVNIASEWSKGSLKKSETKNGLREKQI